MKNKTLYQQLESQYIKLKVRLQKAVVSGRFSAFSAFKQQQWLRRIQHCHVQLMRAGVGMAMVAVLGVGNELEAQVPQYEFTERTGMQNPFDTMSNDNISHLTFADLDGDRDLDMIVDPALQGGLLYYQNVGGPTRPEFRQIVNTNPLHVTRVFSANVHGVTFVDIDNDGDLDMFATNGGSVANTNNDTEIYYAENTGVASNANFSDSTNAASHPLKDARSYIAGLALSGNRRPIVSFVDVDNDGDFDCFIGIYTIYGFTAGTKNDKVLYYKNMGNPSTPDFQRQPSSSNLLQTYIDAVAMNEMPEYPMVFTDFDQDGDQDVVVQQYSYTYNSVIEKGTFYVENVGNINAPSFIARTDSFPEQVIDSIGGGRRIMGWGDLSGDGKIDVVGRGSTRPVGGGAFPFRYFETDTIKVLSVFPIARASKTLPIYPNPSNGMLYWDRPLTGTVRLFDQLGQEMYSKELFEEKELRLEEIPRGLYILQIATKEEEFVQLLNVQ